MPENWCLINMYLLFANILNEIWFIEINQNSNFKLIHINILIYIKCQKKASEKWFKVSMKMKY